MQNNPGLTIEADDPSGTTYDADDIISEVELEQALLMVPRGALVLASIAVGTLMLGWLAVYFLVFLPRGPIG